MEEIAGLPAKQFVLLCKEPSLQVFYTISSIVKQVVLLLEISETPVNKGISEHVKMHDAIWCFSFCHHTRNNHQISRLQRKWCFCNFYTEIFRIHLQGTLGPNPVVPTAIFPPKYFIAYQPFATVMACFQDLSQKRGLCRIHLRQKSSK